MSSRDVLRVAVIGLGNQGKKRLRFAGADVVCTVDPLNLDANFKDISEVPLDIFDAALVCTPENLKSDICSYLISHSKHILCEKPLTVSSIEELNELETLSRKKNVFLYVAYNHRFEPALTEARRLLQSPLLGDLYSMRLFYGNGTAQLVKSSPWRDSGLGVIGDLCPHLFDLLTFWNLSYERNFNLLSASSFETAFPDHAVLSTFEKNPKIQIEVTLCKWENSFQCDILGSKGSLHIDGLMKWGDVSLQIHKRTLPSGVPEITILQFPSGDPTWEIEYAYFKSAVAKGALTDLSNEKYIRKQLVSIGKELGTVF